MSGQQNEKRRDVRVTFRTTVKLSFPDGRTFDECETSDVSVSGVFVKGVTGVDCGDKCQVKFHLSGRTSSLVLELDGEIVRTQAVGVALQFFEVDEDSFYHLQNIVYFSYKHADDGGGSEILGGDDTIDDEALYLDLDANGETAPLPDNYLDEINAKDSDDFDDDLDDDITTHVNRYQEEDDY
ncbi:MAG: PilZ domain-containing protein [Thermodesulfobacteriota bacterium]